MTRVRKTAVDHVKGLVQNPLFQSYPRIFIHFHKAQAATLARYIRPRHLACSFDPVVADPGHAELHANRLPSGHRQNALKAQSTLANVEQYAAVVGTEVDVC